MNVKLKKQSHFMVNLD